VFVAKVSFLPEILREYKSELKETLRKLVVVVRNDEVHCNKVPEVVWPSLQKCLFTAPWRSPPHCKATALLFQQHSVSMYYRLLVDLVMPPFRLSAWGFESFEDLKLSYFW
jgi:hypothetical protein